MAFFRDAFNWGRNFVGSTANMYGQAAQGAYDQEANVVGRSPFVQNFDQGSWLNDVRGGGQVYNPPSSTTRFGDVSHAGQPSSAASSGVYNQPGGDWIRPYWQVPAISTLPSYQPTGGAGVSIGNSGASQPYQFQPVVQDFSPMNWFDAVYRPMVGREPTNSTANDLLFRLFGSTG